MPSTDAEPSVSDLLLKALDSLDDGERRRVLSALISTHLAAAPSPAARAIVAPPTAFEPAMHAALQSASGATMQVAKAAGSTSPRLVPLPVRLTAPDYERLKTWCTEHDFPMSAVIRGLVERFLDDQQVPRVAD